MWNTSKLAVTVAGFVALGAVAVTLNTRNIAAQSTSLGFLSAGNCYRVAFPIESPPNYKVLEVLDGGWIRAEVDAGTAKAQRPSMWINTAQIISMRQVPCSA